MQPVLLENRNLFDYGAQAADNKTTNHFRTGTAQERTAPLNEVRSYFSYDSESMETVMETFGPAIDDEAMSWQMSTFLLGESSEGENAHEFASEGQLDSADVRPIFDPESNQALVDSLGLAIDDEEPSYYMSHLMVE